MRDEIVKYLGTVMDSTAKTIAARIAQPHFDVAKELNKMHADGVVERQKRTGGGNEYLYWLAGTPRATGPSPAELAAKNSVPFPPAAPAAAIPIAGEQPPADPVVVQELLAELEAERSTSARLRQEAETALTSLQAAIATVERLKQNNAQLERKIDDLTLGPPGSKGPVFFTVGRNCDSKRHTSIEKARKRANALVRSERETEVHVCAPVGRVVRGVEWVGK
ncbi:MULTISPECIES: hypothetical protein [Burkholderia]|uniref:1-pyrroline-5-carboxylate dehydrogenase n=1 Tax=Burkholderia glumae TaxID=337 RepID=A0AAQ0BTI7_BURGL|nr:MULTISPECIES: hypothetical protein [Burkholderia]ACR29178.1 Delta 1-pyrroline-5-carboxylate dehydrogenase [Burkholderia glumae BGR1]AJY65560.1 putative delta 1-pyrroline-5-carboxylate dehydrogenase [Burkholderia glumae LMG 2196 = ATCC 33617]PNL01268.1 1-pyrroline-5-carboxylate dehydrogenase [Burkholderia glumae]QPQ93188.1 1-pyrroline-5-carboxylate dehydrogenase [Burkholderia glumae]QQM91609.1 1-pyrroline-5-carboxylate dehydrogenase [Burkholderia glumae]